MPVSAHLSLRLRFVSDAFADFLRRFPASGSGSLIEGIGVVSGNGLVVDTEVYVIVTL